MCKPIHCRLIIPFNPTNQLPIPYSYALDSAAVSPALPQGAASESLVTTESVPSDTVHLTSRSFSPRIRVDLTTMLAKRVAMEMRISCLWEC